MIRLAHKIRHVATHKVGLASEIKCIATHRVRLTSKIRHITHRVVRFLYVLLNAELSPLIAWFSGSLLGVCMLHSEQVQNIKLRDS